MDSFGDIYIKVFRKRRFSSDDKCFSSLMRIDDAIKIFGDYPIMKVNFNTEYSSTLGGEYKTLCALLCLKEEESQCT
jgi:hypothetical protein